MLKFNPPELRERLAEASATFERLLGWSLVDFGDDLDPADPDFDPEDFPDGELTSDDAIEVSLFSRYSTTRLTYGQLAEIASELESMRMEARSICWTKTRALFRVTPIFDEWVRISRLFPTEDGFNVRLFSTELEYSEVTYSISLAHGPTLFAFGVLAYLDYDSNLFPAVLDDDFFVEIRFGKEPNLDFVKAAVQAYLFELSTSVDIGLQLSPRPEFDLNLDESEDASAEDNRLRLRVRPLLVGRGLAEVLALYNEGLGAESPLVQILYFSKVLEHVAQTVTQKELVESTRRKLASRRALEPDADYVLELREFFESQRSFRKEKEAIVLTIRRVADSVGLAQQLPPFLVHLQEDLRSSKQQDATQALEKIADAVVSTRNAVAHAKPNYRPTGTECPDNEVVAFSALTRLLAEQAVRWFGSVGESERVTSSGRTLERSYSAR